MAPRKGAVISPILANIYLHHVFDLWVHHWRNKNAKGDVVVIRYADDTVLGFQYKQDAEVLLEALKNRLSDFSLAFHPAKTRMLEFGRYAQERRAKRGKGKPETFDFLGFTHYCSRARRNGWFKVERKTITKRMRTPTLPKDNPFDIAKMSEVRSPRYVPPLEDFWKVYNVAEGQDKVMLSACFFLAARRGELFRLKVEDLDFENDKIRLWTKKREDGNSEYDWLPMTTKLRESFSYWLDTRDVTSDFVFVCVDKTEFTKEYYGQPFTSRQHLFERLCEKAKVDKFGFHAIRHLTATQLYKQGRSVAEIQRILRHTSPNTTVRYLKTLGVDDIRTAMDSFQATCKEALD